MLRLTNLTGFGAGRAAAAPSGDPDWNSVVLLAGFDGADGATSFSDESPAAHGAFTFVDNAQLDTAQKKFGESSLLCDGAGDYVSLPDHADWTMPGELTVECWFRLNALSDSHILMAHWNPSGNQRAWLVQPLSSSGEMWFAISANGSSFSIAKLTGISYSTGVWYFVRGTRDSSDVLRVALDGAVGGTTPTLAGMRASNSILTVGATGAGATPFNGWIDESRVTTGVARTIDEVPTSKFPRSGP